MIQKESYLEVADNSGAKDFSVFILLVVQVSGMPIWVTY